MALQKKEEAKQVKMIKEQNEQKKRQTYLKMQNENKVKNQIGLQQKRLAQMKIEEERKRITQENCQCRWQTKGWKSDNNSGQRTCLFSHQ